MSREMSGKTTRERSCSKGDELWQIHLQRSAAANPEETEDDHDYPQERHPKKSIGEELFEIHLKRAKGLEPDYDSNNAKEVEKKAMASRKKALPRSAKS